MKNKTFLLFFLLISGILFINLISANCTLTSPIQCGSGLFNLCDRAECEDCGYSFTPGVLGDTSGTCIYNGYTCSQARGYICDSGKICSSAYFIVDDTNQCCSQPCVNPTQTCSNLGLVQCGSSFVGVKSCASSNSWQICTLESSINDYCQETHPCPSGQKCENNGVCSSSCASLNNACSSNSDCCDFSTTPQISCYQSKCIWESPDNYKSQNCNNIQINGFSGKNIDSSKVKCLGPIVVSLEYVDNTACNIAKSVDRSSDCSKLQCCVGETKFIGPIGICQSCEEFSLSTVLGWTNFVETCNARKGSIPIALIGSIFNFLIPGNLLPENYPQTYTTCAFSFIKLALAFIVLIFGTLFSLDFLNKNIKSLKGKKGKAWLRFGIALLIGIILTFTIFIAFWIGLILFIIIIIVRSFITRL